MEETSILLLDFSPSGGLGAELRAILASVPRWTVKLQKLSPGEKGAVALNQRLAGNPSVVFFVLPAALLKQGQRIFQGMPGVAEPPLIVVPEASKPDEILNLLDLGVADFITPPLKALDILTRVRRLLKHLHQRRTPAHGVKEEVGFKKLIGDSVAFRAAVKKIPLIARCDSTVLIGGETGTGKELCARVIHYLGPRLDQPFVPVNCGAIPTELVENELFGHERGAFTDASRSQTGLIREADGGTMFLDEIDCLPLQAQVKLLRFLQEKEYRPLGSAKMRKADVRVIAAANIDLDQAVKTGKLRQDFYYRLNIIPLRLPPLRERRQDIVQLARHFLTKYATEFNKPTMSFSADAERQLVLYEWPGNVRELEHMVERAVALAERDVIDHRDLNLPHTAMALRPTSFREAKARFERMYAEDLLLAHGGNITKAAEAAHKNRRAFWELLRKHHIDVNCFKAATIRSRGSD